MQTRLPFRENLQKVNMLYHSQYIIVVHMYMGNQLCIHNVKGNNSCNLRLFVYIHIHDVDHENGIQKNYFFFIYFYFFYLFFFCYRLTVIL
jgi:hypothetical protein